MWVGASFKEEGANARFNEWGRFCVVARPFLCQWSLKCRSNEPKCITKCQELIWTLDHERISYKNVLLFINEGRKISLNSWIWTRRLAFTSYSKDFIAFIKIGYHLRKYGPIEIKTGSSWIKTGGTNRHHRETSAKSWINSGRTQKRSRILYRPTLKRQWVENDITRANGDLQEKDLWALRTGKNLGAGKECPREVQTRALGIMFTIRKWGPDDTGK